MFLISGRFVQSLPDREVDLAKPRRLRHVGPRRRPRLEGPRAVDDAHCPLAVGARRLIRGKLAVAAAVLLGRRARAGFTWRIRLGRCTCSLTSRRRWKTACWLESSSTDCPTVC